MKTEVYSFTYPANPDAIAEDYRDFDDADALENFKSVCQLYRDLADCKRDALDILTERAAELDNDFDAEELAEYGRHHVREITDDKGQLIELWLVQGDDIDEAVEVSYILRYPLL